MLRTDLRAVVLGAAAATLALTVACGPGPAGGGGAAAALADAGSGANAPGGFQDFTFDVTDADTTLLLEVSPDPTTGAASHLLVKHGAAIAGDADFDWASQRAGRNWIALERPELLTGTYHVRVATPASAPGTHAFTLRAGKGEPVRTATFPVSKPFAFDAGGELAAGVPQYFRVVVPASPQGARAAAACGAGCALGLSAGADPAGGYAFAPEYDGSTPRTLFAAPDALAAGSERFLRVSAPTARGFVLHVEDVYARTLGWDPGLAATGTVVAGEPDAVGGEYLFRVDPQAPTLGAWRAALWVTGGEADLWASQGTAPVNGAGPHERSERTGDDGFVRPDHTASPSTPWYLLVRAEPGASWRLLAGDVFAHDLGALAEWDSGASSSGALPEAARVGPGSAAVPVGPEGTVFFRTSIPAGTEAWRLWGPSSPGALDVRRTKVPLPGLVERTAPAQLLVVPPYLTSDVYFVGITAAPGSAVILDSRRQRIRTPSLEPSHVSSGAHPDFAFELEVGDDGGFEFVTYRISVPVEQIAWQVAAQPLSGEADVYLRKGFAPNVGQNDAFSEAGAGVTDSVTVVPPALTDGTWYVTVHGSGTFRCRLTSGNPVITGVPFLNDPATPASAPRSSGAALVNDAPDRSGWRYYQVADITSQLGALGWELLLAGGAPGAQLALRRNAVPGHWTYRQETGPGTASAHEASHHDHVSSTGHLQRPGHQADIWYVGVYAPGVALGAFELTTRELPADVIGFNADGAVVAAQPAETWRYFKITVPEAALGWDLRLANVTSGLPRLVVRRDTLPDAFTTDYPYSDWLPQRPDWPTSYRWAPECDWTRRCTDADGTVDHGRRLVAGMGSPLSPGTYYVGVQGRDATPLSYTLESRGIGAGDDPQGAPWALQVADLDFASGVATVAALAPREAAYYRVTVPAGATSWGLRLTPDAPGEAMLALSRDVLPSQATGAYATDSGRSGVRRQKDGAEYFYKFPASGQAELAPAVYYVAVVSEGTLPSSPGHVGLGGVAATLESAGLVPVDDRTSTPVAVGQPVAWSAQALPWGAQRTYRFRVPAGLEALQVRLRPLAGTPELALRRDPEGEGRRPTVNGHYGAAEGGEWSPWFTSDDPVTVAPPEAGDYTIAVGSWTADRLDMTYDLEVEALTSQALAFNGGTAAVTAHEAGTWRYFHVTVPPGALGWDVRLRDVTAGSPRLVIRRDVAPATLTTSGSSYYGDLLPWRRVWPSGHQWAGWNAPYGGDSSPDWTGRGQDAAGEDVQGRRIAAAMGAPLEPGDYVVGVTGASATETLEYTLESRGVGAGDDADGAPWALQVVDLPFAGGSATVADLAPREPAYFRVTIPPTATSFDAALVTSVGEAMLASRAGFLPNSLAGGGTTFRSKDGPEWYYDYGPYDVTTLAAGDYYFAAVSEGEGAVPGRSGASPSTFTFRTVGEAPVDDRTGTPVQAGGAVEWTGQVLPYGAHGRYRFRVPAGISSLELRFLNVTGGPLLMCVHQDPAGAGRIPAGNQQYGAATGGPYCQATGSSTAFVSWSEPPAGDYTVVVAAGWGASPDSSAFDLRVTAQGLTQVAFNGGTASVVGQEPGTVRYFRVEVPAEALGWYLRIRDVAAGSAQLVVQRDTQPTWIGPSNTSSYDGYRKLPHAPEWRPGDAWAGGNVWTVRTDPLDGQYQNAILAGMGSPLVPGTYFVGVSGGPAALTYTLESLGIGVGEDAAGVPWSVPVQDLPLAGSATGTLAPLELAVHRVEVPAGTTSWAVELDAPDGDAVLGIGHAQLPNSWASPDPNWGHASDDAYSHEGALRRVDGREHFYKFPRYDQAELTPGTYYLAVLGEGGPMIDGTHLGASPATYTLTSLGPAAVEDRTGTPLSTAAPIAWTGQTKAPGQERFYRVRVPEGIAALEIGLANRTGAFAMTLHAAEAGAGRVPQVYSGGRPYRGEGGAAHVAYGAEFITWPAPAPGDYTVRVVGDDEAASQLDVVVAAREPERLTLDPVANVSAGDTSDVMGSLASGQRRYYAIDVPETMALPDGEPVVGWKLQVGETNGNAKLRLRKGALPGAIGGTTESVELMDAPEVIVTTPLLEPGRWYLEVLGEGLTDYLLASRVVRAERPEAVEQAPRTWTMPPDANVVFGDSGVLPDGSPVVNPNTGDPGVDLAAGESHFYRVTVPAGNGGLLRTLVEAYSGNPDLYLRAGAVPSVSHFLPPSASYSPWSYAPRAYDRSQQSSGTMYGNWVPLGASWQRELPPGDYWLMVHAAGGSNARYRLAVSTGDVQALAQDGGVLRNQALAAGDLRYYRVQIPASPPALWRVTFAQQLGDATLYLRDTVPPGFGASPPSQPSYMVSWTGEANLSDVPYPHEFDEPGTFTFGVPPVQPGGTYYLGVHAKTDSVFDVSSAVSGAPVVIPDLAFVGGTATGTLAPGETVFYRVAVPAGAPWWKHRTVEAAGVAYSIGIGALPSGGWYAWHSWSGNTALQTPLAAGTRWAPGQPYFVKVTNGGAAPAPYTFAMHRLDEDGDGYVDVAFGGDDCDDLRTDRHPGAAPRCSEWIDADCNGSIDPQELACCPDGDADGHKAAHCGGDDCDDAAATVHPGAAEACNGRDDDCSGAPGATEVDGDADGALACADCDDASASIRPGATDVCEDGVDQDCSGADAVCPCPDADGDGQTAARCGGTDCDDAAASVHPGAAEICGDGVDQDCSGADPVCACADADADGYPAAGCGGTDCDDRAATVHPGAAETCGDLVDQDCDGRDLACPCPDADGDGYPAAGCGGTDCDDANAAVHPTAPEVCGNGRDDDCAQGDLACTCPDADRDGHADAACGGTDCDDQDAAVHPYRPELCGDAVDQDCSGADLACVCADADGDGYLAASCGGNDCDDTLATVHPSAAETCGDGVDQDCSGGDAACPCPDADGDGFPAAACGGTDCDDGAAAVRPGAADACGDGVDQDCTGADAACACPDADADGYRAASCGGTDCDDARAVVHPGAAEVCGDAVDQDCTGADEPCGCPDRDGDGHLDAACGGADCNDGNATVHPGAAETCGDGIDQDCAQGDLACGCADADGDGYRSALCGGNDCDDTLPAVHPNAADACGDGVDQDCRGGDPVCVCGDLDRDGYPAAGCGGTDCDDGRAGVHPGATETCGDGVDQDCSGADAVCPCPDADGDGHRAASCGGTDCDDASAAVHRAATEQCANQVDDDCDGYTDALDPQCAPPPKPGGGGGGGGCGTAAGAGAPVLLAIVAALLRRRRPGYRA